MARLYSRASARHSANDNRPRGYAGMRLLTFRSGSDGHDGVRGRDEHGPVGSDCCCTGGERQFGEGCCTPSLGARFVVYCDDRSSRGMEVGQTLGGIDAAFEREELDDLVVGDVVIFSSIVAEPIEGPSPLPFIEPNQPTVLHAQCALDAVLETRERRREFMPLDVGVNEVTVAVNEPVPLLMIHAGEPFEIGPLVRRELLRAPSGDIRGGRARPTCPRDRQGPKQGPRDGFTEPSTSWPRTTFREDARQRVSVPLHGVAARISSPTRVASSGGG